MYIFKAPISSKFVLISGNAIPMSISQAYSEAASYIKSRLPSHLSNPQVGIICGSGLSGLADQLTDSVSIDYADIPHFEKTSVAGHKHTLKIGLISGKSCMVFMGRFHGYEEDDKVKSTLQVRVLASLNVPNLIITNSAGSVNTSVCGVGDFLVIEDHISFPCLAGLNPLSGPNLDQFGPRFPSLHGAYYPGSYELLTKAAVDAQIPSGIIKRGAYCHVWGPTYETPLEVKFLSMIGCAAVGMSTVPEVIAAAHSNQIKKTIVISLITNEPAVDGVTGPTHEEVLAVAAARAIELRSVVASLVKLL